MKEERYKIEVLGPFKSGPPCKSEPESNKFHKLRGGIKKKILVFFRKTPKGGGGVSLNPKFSYQKKLRFFWNFFYKGGGLTYSKRVLS